MKKIGLKDVKPYDAPGHFRMTAMRLQGKEETGEQKFYMGSSHFLPEGGAEWGYEDCPLGKVHLVLEGEITVKTKSGEVVVRKCDSVFLEPCEGREIRNKTNLPASMLVFINYPE